jgi:hypothetical protein
MTPTRKIGVGAFLLGSIAGGAIGLSGLASAASNDDSTTATTAVVDDSSTTSDTSDDTNSDAGTDTAGEPAGPHQANGITEEELTGDTATSVEAAVLAAYPDATIERLETDAEGAAYEAHVTLADGRRATVKLDESFAVTATETGPDGHGGGPGGRGGGPHEANGITEEEVTGDTVTSVEAAVTAAYPDATIDRMETDADGGAYEAHITLADGSRATVTLDDSFTITGTSTD